VAEDERPFREAICDLVASEADMEIIGAAVRRRGGDRLARQTAPDVPLVDIKMHDGGRARAADVITSASLDAKVLTLSAYEARGSVLEELRHRAVLPGQGSRPGREPRG
jgi:DNA-binding NarL/FixJ family response regulator